jgi:hypothetical protein
LTCFPKFGRNGKPVARANLLRDSSWAFDPGKKPTASENARRGYPSQPMVFPRAKLALFGFVRFADPLVSTT